MQSIEHVQEEVKLEEKQESANKPMETGEIVPLVDNGEEAKVSEVEPPKVISRLEELIFRTTSHDFNFDDFETLIFDGITLVDLTPEDKIFLEKFTECRQLSFNECGLRSLLNFPTLAKLTRLELASNRLFSRKDPLGQLPLLYKQLQHLVLANNFLDYESVRPLGKLGDTLTKVDLSSNQVTDSHNYPNNLFDLITSLRVLDGRDKDGKEFLEDLDNFDEYEEERGIAKNGTTSQIQSIIKKHHSVQQIQLETEREVLGLDDDEEEDFEMIDTKQKKKKDNVEDDEEEDDEDFVEDDEEDPAQDEEEYYVEDEIVGEADDGALEEEDEDDEESNDGSALGKRVKPVQPLSAASFAKVEESDEESD